MKIIKNINLTYLYIKDLVIEYYNNFNNYIYYYIFFSCGYLSLIYISTFFSLLNNYILYFCYWFGLGLLSTIGFGFGFHTVIFFLFPYVINIKNLAINNNTTDFGGHSFGQSWGRIPSVWGLTYTTSINDQCPAGRSKTLYAQTSKTSRVLAPVIVRMHLDEQCFA